jgi:hypothetical protein
MKKLRSASRRRGGGENKKRKARLIFADGDF